MAVIPQFKLGRAAYESLFQVNPSAVSYRPQRIADFSRGLDGTGIDVTASPNRPSVRINGNYITPAQRNQFISLMTLGYEPLVFEPMNFSGSNVWESWQERVIPETTLSFPLMKTSMTEAAKWKQLNGGTHAIVPVGLWADMDRAHGRIGPAANLILPGIWGHILLEDFNSLPTGLLADTGKNWQVLNGNGTTRDAFVSTVSPIEGTKSALINSDGSGIYVFCHRANGGLWDPNSVYAQRGYDALQHTAKWKAQLIGTGVSNHASFYTSGHTGPSQWGLALTVTSATTATYEFWVNGVQVVAPATLPNPFLSHDYRVEYDGTNIKAYVDVTEIYNQPATLLPWNTFSFYGQGFTAEDIVRVDAIDIYDGDGYNPATGLFDIVVSAPLTIGKPYFFTFQYNAIAVHFDAMDNRVEGGWVNFEKYDFDLLGA